MVCSHPVWYSLTKTEVMPIELSIAGSNGIDGGSEESMEHASQPVKIGSAYA